MFRLVRSCNLRNYRCLFSLETFPVIYNSTSIYNQRCLHQKSNNFQNHRRRSIAAKIKNEKSDNSKQKYYFGAFVFSSILAIYFYDRYHKVFPFNFIHKQETNLKNSASVDLKDSEPSNDVKQNKDSKTGSFRGKYSSMNFFADIVEQASPSVAFIQAQGHHPFFPMAVNVSSGSGFLVDNQDGIILTNAHVIANCQQVSIQFNDGRKMNGTVEFVDERLDLATVRVPPARIKDLEPIPLAITKQTRAGEWVIAVGSPFALSNTVTVGVISSISRAGRDLGIRDIDYIQTDSSINIGNSGGPLLDLDGEAIGINTLKVGEGISFAIPAFYANEFLKKCKNFRDQSNDSWTNRRSNINSEHSEATPTPNRRFYLGFTIVTLTPHLIESHRYHDPNFPQDIQGGVMIYQLVLGAPAHLSGLENGDIITAINGKEVRTLSLIHI